MLKISNYIIFKTSQNRQELDLDFLINDTKIDRVTETLFLGVIIDECLKGLWHSIAHVRLFDF